MIIFELMVRERLTNLTTDISAIGEQRNERINGMSESLSELLITTPYLHIYSIDKIFDLRPETDISSVKEEL